MIKITSISKIFLIGAMFILGLYLCTDSALAQVTYNALVTIPFMPLNPSATDYLSGIYTFLTRVVGIVAMGAIIIGGARYLTSVGNPSAVEDAKHTINSAIIGLILAVSSWVIVTEINPDITVLKSPTMATSPIGTYVSGSTTPSQCAYMSEGTGIVGSPCKCIDGKDVYAVGAGGIATLLTLNVAPATTGNAVANTVVMTGKLTNASTGVGIAGATITINKIFALGGASTRYIPALTNASGDFSYNYDVCSDLSCGAGNRHCTTDAGPDTLQAVFAGGVIGPDTFASSGSATTLFTVGGTPKTCTAAMYAAPGLYPVATLWAPSAVAGSNQCNTICQTPAMADDGKYHCIKLNVKRGRVGKNSGYSDEQFRALATNLTTENSPFVSVDDDEVVVEVERASTVLNTPVQWYQYDSDGNMTCDTIIPGWYHAVSLYNAADGLTDACSLTVNPKGETCSIKFCVKDSLGHEGETLLYYTILAPS